ncbi:hypothetical protein ACFLWX_00280 [Chloroflexota bacterium]
MAIDHDQPNTTPLQHERTVLPVEVEEFCRLIAGILRRPKVNNDTGFPRNVQASNIDRVQTVNLKHDLNKPKKTK